jgi:hypothetical protein
MRGHRLGELVQRVEHHISATRVVLAVEGGEQVLLPVDAARLGDEQVAWVEQPRGKGREHSGRVVAYALVRECGAAQQQRRRLHLGTRRRHGGRDEHEVCTRELDGGVGETCGEGGRELLQEDHVGRSIRVVEDAQSHFLAAFEHSTADLRLDLLPIGCDGVQ